MVALFLCDDGQCTTRLVCRCCLGYGAAFGLVGWCVIRRFGTRGLVAFLAVFAFGVTPDYLYSITISLIIFGPGLVPLVADLFAYSAAASLVQLLTCRIASPPRSGTLARMPPHRVALIHERDNDFMEL